MKKHYLLLAFTAFLLVQCTPSKNAVNTKENGTLLKEKPAFGIWRMTLGIEDKVLPFNFELSAESGEYFATIINGPERIKSEKIRFSGDSCFFRLPIFDSEFKGKMKNSGHVSGLWFNYFKCCDYTLPFEAQYGENYRFKLSSDTQKTRQIAGKWEVTFSPETEDEYKAIGVFEQTGNKATGTFMTETGDYRFLEGVIDGNRLELSCFDGSHAFLFDASLLENEELKGMFYSGKHWKEPWIAKRNSSFELTNPDSLTFIKDGYNGIAFSFPDVDGKMISYPTEQYKGEVVIVQLMGSWCPNCMDETRFFKSLYDKYHTKGLEIISLCFERSDIFEDAARNVNNHRTHLDAPWEFLIAGQSGKDQAAKALPMLNHVMSFPTSIFIDKAGNVRKIHTGFYGPGTGNYYQRYSEQIQEFVVKLLNE